MESLSPSGSVANPTSALFLVTDDAKLWIFGGMGSGDLPKSSL